MVPDYQLLPPADINLYRRKVLPLYPWLMWPAHTNTCMLYLRPWTSVESSGVYLVTECKTESCIQHDLAGQPSLVRISMNRCWTLSCRGAQRPSLQRARGHLPLCDPYLELLLLAGYRLQNTRQDHDTIYNPTTSGRTFQATIHNLKHLTLIRAFHLA